MITEYGKVIITEEHVEVTEFTFNGSDHQSACIEALEWAKAHIEDGIAEEKTK